MKFKKIVAMLLSCSMIAAMVTGCGHSESSSEEKEASSVVESTEAAESVAAAETQAAETGSESEEFDPRSITEGVKLTIAIPDNTRIIDWNTNEETLMVEEKFGVDLEFISFPAADFEQKINVMIMGGDELPDIIFNGSKSAADWSGWIAEEALLPLTEYYNDPNMASNIMEGSELTGIDMAAALTMADGEIYYFPAFGASPNAEVYSRLWYYEPWLEAIGMDVPTTTEEFYEVCKKVSETDLNGNGKKDEIALGGDLLGGGDTDGWFTCLMSGFVYAHDKEYRIVEDGKVGYAYTTDEWKEGLKYIKRFFDEGLIPMETLTQSQDQWKAQLAAEEQTVFCFNGWEPFWATNKAYDWVVDNDCLMPLEGPEGEAYAMYRPGTPKIGAAITVDCENPEAAFLVCDYLCSEEMTITKRWGKRGENWDYWDEAQVENKEDYSAYDSTKDIYIIAYDDDSFWSGSEPTNVCYLGYGPGIYSDRVFGGRAVKTGNLTDDEALKLQFDNEVISAYTELHNYSPAEVIDYAPLTTDENQEISEIKANLANYVNEMTGAFLTGNKDIDADWDAYIQELEKIGYKTALEIYQVGYDRVH